MGLVGFVSLAVGIFRGGYLGQCFFIWLAALLRARFSMNSSSMCAPFPRTVISVSAPSSSARIASAGGIRTSTRERPVHLAFHQSALVTFPGPDGHGHRRAGGLVPPQHAPPVPGRSEYPAVIFDRRNSFIYQTGRRRSIASMGPRTGPSGPGLFERLADGALSSTPGVASAVRAVPPGASIRLSFTAFFGGAPRPAAAEPAQRSSSVMPVRSIPGSRPHTRSATAFAEPQAIVQPR